MKRVLSIVLLLTLVFAMTACTGGPSVETGVNTETDSAIKNSENDQNQVNETKENTDSNNKENATVYPLTLVDHYGREVTIDKKPERVVSLAPSLTETLDAIGTWEVLKGRTDYDTYPPKVEGVPSVGTLKDPSIETIVEMGPDLILASTHFQEETMKKLDELDLTVVILSAQDSFEGVYDVIEKTGLIFDRQDKADQLVKDMKTKVETVASIVSPLEATEVYYVVGYGEYGDYTAGKGTFIDQMIRMAGGKNVASDVEGWSYSLEKIVEKDPYIIICSQYFDAKEGIETANGYKDLTAVKEGRLVEIDNDLLDRQGPRLADGLEELAKILHPDAFASNN